MPELPDITIYVEALNERICGDALHAIRLASPFVLRTTSPTPDELAGRRVQRTFRIGKRIVIELAAEGFIAIHLMIAGRLLWTAKPPRTARNTQATFEFGRGTLALTEAGTRKRAAVHLAHGSVALHSLDRGGLEILGSDHDEFARALRRENHTMRRALTDPRLFSGVGNAYSDEILHAARLSPMQLTSRLSSEEVRRLHHAAVATLTHWIGRLRAHFAGRFPGRGEITAFRPDFAVHGRFGQPCPVCGAPVQRIRYAENETNYCPTCQTDGRVLADRSLSRLLRDDWPRTVAELE